MDDALRMTLETLLKAVVEIRSAVAEQGRQIEHLSRLVEETTGEVKAIIGGDVPSSE